MEDLLKQIVKNTKHKTSFQIIVSDRESRFTTRFNLTLQLDKDKEYEITLVNLETYYSFPNIDKTNNIFFYSPDNGNSWVKIKIPEGSYEIDNINYTIHHEMEKRGHYDPINEDYYINFSANSNTPRSILILEEDYQVDFNHQILSLRYSDLPALNIRVTDLHAKNLVNIYRRSEKKSGKPFNH